MAGAGGPARRQDAHHASRARAASSRRTRPSSPPSPAASPPGSPAASRPYEIWNEADEGLFWSGRPRRPGAYVNLLQACYAAIKAADPNVDGRLLPDRRQQLRLRQEPPTTPARRASSTSMAVHTDTACLDRGARPATTASTTAASAASPSSATARSTRSCRTTATAQADLDDRVRLVGRAPHLRVRRRRRARSPPACPRTTRPSTCSQAMNCMEADPYVTVAMWFNSRDLNERRQDGQHVRAAPLQRLGAARRSTPSRRGAPAAGARAPPCGDFEGPDVRILEPTADFGPRARRRPLYIRAKSGAPRPQPILFRVEGPGAGPLFTGTNNNAHHAQRVRRRRRDREWGGAARPRPGKHTLAIWPSTRTTRPGPGHRDPVREGSSAGTAPRRRAAAAPPRSSSRSSGSPGKGRNRTFRGGSLPGHHSAAPLRIEWYLKTKVKGRAGSASGSATTARPSSPAARSSSARSCAATACGACARSTSGIPGSRRRPPAGTSSRAAARRREARVPARAPCAPRCAARGDSSTLTRPDGSRNASSWRSRRRGRARSMSRSVFPRLLTLA